MDPNATLRDFLEALRDRDCERASDAFWTLFRWRQKGGFAPVMKGVIRC
jgi:hypothetical protein